MDNGLGKSLSFRTGFGPMKLRAEMAFLFQDAVVMPLKAGTRLSNLLSTEPHATQQSCQRARSLKPDCLLPILIQTLAGCVALGELFTLKHAKLT